MTAALEKFMADALSSGWFSHQPRRKPLRLKRVLCWLGLRRASTGLTSEAKRKQAQEAAYYNYYPRCKTPT